MNANLRNFALWVIIVLLLLALFTLFQNPGQRASSQDITFSQLLSEVDQGKVRDVVIQGPDIHGTFTNGSSFQTYAPNDPTLVKRLYDGKVQITAKPPGDNVPWFVSLLVSWLPFIALIGVWVFLSRQMQGGAGKAMGFGKSRAKMLTEAARRAPGRPSRYRQDPDRACGRGRSQRAVLHHFGFGLRRNVRRRRRQPRPRHVRAGQEERALHHLHRRNRRRRSS